ncbi:N-methyl-L-tryptophan oxidase [Paenibacillus sp. RC67]|uniref:N-methyl-L-tryptophan oxidase n=1 Tax=Paenibacillus sp. RC67 TaxID=3039392 RepID=UPI0024AE428A|nr:N-methyl-L-tryptophan oxidase [Paenibacillus sp. RC67]
MSTSYDVIVVGAGSMGMSAGYYLAKQGVRTLLLDAFDPPHTAGSHHGETRLIRHAYAGSLTYTAMALRSDQLWMELEAASGETLLIRSGVLNIGPSEASGLKSKWSRSREHGLPVDYLSAEEIRYRWTGIHLPESYIGLYEQQAGFLLSEACVGAFRKQAIAHGAVVMPHSPVVRIETSASHVTVHTHTGTFTADRAIISLGAWFNLLDGLDTLPIKPVRKAVGWFEADEALFDYTKFPGFTLGWSEGGYYGFPSMNGSGVKIGRHDVGQPWQPGQNFEPFGNYPEDEQDLRQALEQFMPRASGRLLRGAVCKYEMTPDEDFIIDTHPEYDRIWIAGGFSGHGFKFSSVVGEILSELIVKGETKQDISPFALSRFKT